MLCDKYLSSSLLQIDEWVSNKERESMFQWRETYLTEGRKSHKTTDQLYFLYVGQLSS